MFGTTTTPVTSGTTPQSRQRFRESLFKVPMHPYDPDARESWAVIEIRSGGDHSRMSIVKVHESESEADRQVSEMRASYRALAERNGGLPFKSMESYGHRLETWWYPEQNTIHGFTVFKVQTALGK